MSGEIEKRLTSGDSLWFVTRDDWETYLEDLKLLSPQNSAKGAYIEPKDPSFLNPIQVQHFVQKYCNPQVLPSLTL